jgi:hypothetical protein
MPRKIDPLNKKQYSSVTAMLTVTDVRGGGRLLSKGIRLCQTRDHEWSRRQSDPCRTDTPRYDVNVGAGNGADGFASRENNRRLADDFVSAGGERRQDGRQGRKLGAALKGPVMDMFWGDRCGTLVDPEGYIWMVATHIAEYTPKQMQQKMMEQIASQQAALAAASGS